MSTKSYYLYIKQFSHDGTNWINVQPLTYSFDGDGTMTPVVKEEHDAACGAMPPIYQWVDTEDTICVYEGHDYSREYLTFEILSAGTITWKTNTDATKTISYSLDNGSTWSSITSTTGGSSFNVSAGDIVKWKGENDAYGNFSSSGSTFSDSTAYFNVEGNIMSLISGDSFDNVSSLSSSYTFGGLFAKTNVISAENLVLPATVLSIGCYVDMFYNCAMLTTAPQLPATSLTKYCYSTMFQRCSGLTTPPELPATSLATACYQGMFGACSNLTTAPELPATTLKDRCYWTMFGNCSSLTTAPDLPAAILKDNCYYQMFNGCRNLNYIKCLATDMSSIAPTENWLNNVSSSGTFVKDANATWPTGVDGIPNNWTIQNA